MTAKDRLIHWFNHEKTPEDAWKTWKLKEIATSARVSEHTVKRVLPVLVREKYGVIDSYAKFKLAREAWRRVNQQPGAGLSIEEIDKLQDLRRSGGDLMGISVDTGYSYRTVQKYCRGIKRGKKRK